MKIAKKEIFYYVLAGLIIIFGLSVYVVKINKQRSLTQNLEYADAVIIKFSWDKSGHYLNYEFSVDGATYKGSSSHYPKTDGVSIGDTILVVYSRIDPSNNRSERDYSAGFRWL